MLQPISNYLGQNANNLVKLYEGDTGCCPDLAAECQYDVVIPTANAVNNIIFKRTAAGDSVTKTFSPAVTGASNVKAAILAALAVEGYENDGVLPVGVDSYTDGTNTVYRITGSLVVVSMLHNTSTTVTATQKCDRVGRCTYTGTYAGGTGSTFTVNGTDVTLGALTYAGTTAAQMDTAIAAAVPAGTVVAVVKNTSPETFTITLIADQGSTFVLAGDDFVESDCGPGYVA
jgi:hypothetical protein